MRLPIIINGFLKGLTPDDIDFFRRACDEHRTEEWYQQAGAIFMDEKHMPREGNLDYRILKILRVHMLDDRSGRGN